jgi:Arc/MetJ-type ribon-helix-helix transcriptional regulator
VNRHALGENPLARRRDSILRNTEHTEMEERALPSSNTVSTETVGPDEATRAADNRIQFVLTPRHLQLLDDLCYEVRRATRYKLNRSEVVRALIEQLENKELHFKHIRSEEDLREQIREVLH